MPILSVLFGVLAAGIAMYNHIDPWLASFVAVFSFISGLLTGILLEEL
jgi:phage shock protein PspC (stress-responsive transcriptional regulator)